MRFIILLSVIGFSFSALSQNLLEERIWKLSDRKKSIFLDAGVFHHLTSQKGRVGLSSVRNSYVSGRDYERLVIDFNATSIPKIYGHISPVQKKLTIDLNDVFLEKPISNLKGAKFIKNFDVVTIDEKNISLVLTAKGKASFDIFYLENPGRLVIDIK